MLILSFDAKNLQNKTKKHLVQDRSSGYILQCNLDLLTVNLVATCDLVTILPRPFFNLIHKIIRFSDIMRFSDGLCGDQKCH